MALPTRMQAHLLIEVAAEDFDGMAEQNVLDVSLPTVEIRQVDGLFTSTRIVSFVEGIGAACRIEAGLDDALPAFRLYVKPQEV